MPRPTPPSQRRLHYDSPSRLSSRDMSSIAYFFFGDGVHNASKLTVVAQDEINLQQQWSKLIEDHDIDSVICVSSALRRGVLDQTEADRHELGTASAYESSEVAGLGQLVDAALHSDRVVNFG